MRPAQRFLLVGIAVALVEATLGTVLLPTVLGAYFWMCAVASVGLAIVARRLLVPPPGDDGGGGRPPGDDPPPDPPWWPEFERAFRRHVQDRVRDDAPV